MYHIVKRFFDLFFSLLGLSVLIPVIIPIMILLRMTAEGEVFFFQERMGYLNRKFGILKFATMLKDSPNMGTKSITVRNDPRITTIGRFLRISKLNELPQIINVIKGEMSLVGPRPLPVTSFDKYSPEVKEILYRNRPGITGIGSLVFRDEEKLVSAAKIHGLGPMEYYRNYIYPYKGALEVWYNNHISFYTDFMILLLTFVSLIHKDSDLVFKIFKTLPPKPESLTLTGIQKL
ncbi:MAG: sugar transferase [Saprospiraceae bacterium]|nr:sugar transferase [Saprospiraceae bacterium]